MPDLIIYLLKVNLAVLLFSAGYYGLLRRLTFYLVNRYYLLFAIGFSIFYPFMDFSALWARQQAIPVMAGVPISTLSFETDRSFSAWPYIEVLLGIALFVMVTRLAVQLLSIQRIHLHSSPDQWRQYAYRNTRQAVSPFSFWKHIYVYRAGHPETELPGIFRHEFIHVQQLHSIDVLLAELLLLFGWFNPGVWLLRRAIRENLEFITDRHVLQSGLDAKTYQYNLLRTLTEHQPRLANNFNFKNLKIRIIMMNKKKSSQYHLGMYLLVVPVILLFVSVFTISKAYQGPDKPTKTKEITIKTYPQDSIIPAKKIRIKGKVTGVVVKKGQPTKHVAVFATEQGKQPLIVLNGTPSNQKTLDAIDPAKIESISVLKDSSATSLYGSKGGNGVILVTTKAGAKSGVGVITVNGRPSSSREDTSTAGSAKADSAVVTIVRGYGNSNSGEPLYVIDGKIASKEAMSKMGPNTIESINVLKDKSAVAAYGELAANGVIEIHSKTDKSPVIRIRLKPDSAKKISPYLDGDPMPRVRGKDSQN